MNLILRFAQARLSAPMIEQAMSERAAYLPKSYYDKIVVEYRKRRDIVDAAIKKIPGAVCQTPRGAFYTTVKLPVSDTEKFARWLLTDFRRDNETVMVAPASGFYATPGLGMNEVRLAYVIRDTELERAMELFRQAVIEYSELEKKELSNRSVCRQE